MFTAQGAIRPKSGPACLDLFYEDMQKLLMMAMQEKTSTIFDILFWYFHLVLYTCCQVTYTKIESILNPFTVFATDEVNSENTEDDVFDVETGVERICLEGTHPTTPQWLQKVESPFNWLPVRFSDVPAKEVITKATERIQMDEGFDAAFPFEK